MSIRIKHILQLEPGAWTVRIKARNDEGWSTYSTEQAVIVPGKPNDGSALQPYYVLYYIHALAHL